MARETPANLPFEEYLASIWPGHMMHIYHFSTSVSLLSFACEEPAGLASPRLWHI